MADIKRAYFTNGSLPAPGTLCEIDRGHFFDANAKEHKTYVDPEELFLHDMVGLAEYKARMRFLL